MEKTFTLDDLQLYLREVKRIEKKVNHEFKTGGGPSKMAVQNLLSYSRALDVLKTSTAGIIFNLAN